MTAVTLLLLSTLVATLFQLLHSNVLQAILAATMHENILRRIQVMQEAALHADKCLTNFQKNSALRYFCISLDFASLILVKSGCVCLTRNVVLWRADVFWTSSQRGAQYFTALL